MLLMCKVWRKEDSRWGRFVAGLGAGDMNENEPGVYERAS